MWMKGELVEIQQMKSPLNAEDEARRVEGVRALLALGLRNDQGLQAIVNALAILFDAGAAVLTLVDRDRLIFVVQQGIPRQDMPRKESFCSSTILSDEVLVVPDGAADLRFANRPLIDDQPRMRFYAGAPLTTPEGHRVGSLCVLDPKPRVGISDHQKNAIKALATLAMDRICALRDAWNRASALDCFETETRPMLAVNAAGAIEYANVAAAELLGRGQAELCGLAFDAVIAPGPLNAGCETLMSVYAHGRESHVSKRLFRTAILGGGGERPVEISVQSWAAPDGAGMIAFVGEAVALANPSGNFAFVRPAAGRNTQADLARALDRGEFLLHYQPQVSMDTGGMHAVEALVRWSDPQRGLLLPKSFLIDVEENGFALPLGWWILDEAASQLAQWRRQGLALQRVSVNLFTAQYRSEALVRRVLQALSVNNLAPEMIELEVTETIALLNDECGLRSLRCLADLGVRIAFDDFGTGYASLSSLQQFPLTTLKLDRSFIQNIQSNRSDAVITKSMIALARDLGLESVAEGIETPGQHDVLAEMGCAVGQGFLYGRPVSAADLPALVAGNDAGALTMMRNSSFFHA
ncbi:PAS domain S-box-containing protein [Rhizobium sp. SG_E_25_P2]|uniref:bifunctional diguanylate cyclase/phosphodiesterase n=1 Tax=Rhizobium sp. SG_E_25_P2 TaxID=2879942 RepID=UPI002475DDF9|nr:EAL domain-containing protein [Rhizobium sp. SG_E_25_P2]MDH6265130.1 PAS domain S-box-containing protein [Rhizobium sp. SG_E_25_P2]